MSEHLLLLVFTLLLYFSCAQQPREFTIEFKPAFPPSHHWDVACQRLENPANNENQTTYIDVDYFHNSKSTVLYLSTVSDFVSSSRSFWMAYGIRNTSTTGGEHWILTRASSTGKLCMNADDGTRSPCFYHNRVITSRVDDLLIVGSLTKPFNLSLSVEDQIWDFGYTINLTNRDLFNRSQCYGIDNYRFFAQELNKQESVQYLILFILKFFIVLGLIAISCIMCRSHLTKRRFWIGLISNISLQIAMFADIGLFAVAVRFNRVTLKLYFDRERDNIAKTVPWSVVFHLFCMIALTAYTYKMLRYFHLKYTYTVMQKDSFSSLTKWQTVLLSKRLFGVMLVIVTLIGYIAVFGVILAIYAGIYRSSLTADQINEAFNVLYIVWIVLMLLVYLGEFLVNIRSIFQKGLIAFYFTRDPLLYRLEAILCALLLVVIIIFTVVSSQAVIVQLSVIFIHACLQLIMGNGAISIIAAFFSLKKLITGEKDILTDGAQLEKLLRDEKFFQLFSNYAYSEQSYENVALWKQLDVGKLAGKVEYATFQQIHDTFIGAGAVFQVNLPSKALRECEKLYDEKKDVQFETLEVVYGNVMTNIADTYSRFTHTDQYKAYSRMKNKMESEFKIS